VVVVAAVAVAKGGVRWHRLPKPRVPLPRSRTRFPALSLSHPTRPSGAPNLNGRPSANHFPTLGQTCPDGNSLIPGALVCLPTSILVLWSDGWRRFWPLGIQPPTPTRPERAELRACRTSSALGLSSGVGRGARCGFCT
jgi:hypothetical protein